MTNPVSDSPDVRIIPPFIYLAGLIAGSLLSLWLPTYVLPSPVAWLIGAVLVAVGAAFAGSAVLNFRRSGTTVRPDRAASTLVIRGPYRLTRNPMYLGLAFVYLGLAIAEQSLWAIILLPVILVIIQRAVIIKEEAFLERRFGQDYAHYRTAVRRWL